MIANLLMSGDGLSFTVKNEAIRPGFYADCSDEDVARATSLLVPEPTAPTRTPIRTTPGNWGRIPRIYIACLRDQTIPHAAQERMYTAQQCERVITMDSSHSPFFSQPEQLAGHLLSL